MDGSFVCSYRIINPIKPTHNTHTHTRDDISIIQFIPTTTTEKKQTNDGAIWKWATHHHHHRPHQHQTKCHMYESLSFKVLEKVEMKKKFFFLHRQKKT